MKKWCLRISQQQNLSEEDVLIDFFFFFFGFCGGLYTLTGLLGTLWQVKSHTHRSSSASSSHEPPNMRHRSCSQLSAPDPEPPEPQSASKHHQKHEKWWIISWRSLLRRQWQTAKWERLTEQILRIYIEITTTKREGNGLEKISTHPDETTLNQNVFYKLDFVTQI